MRRGDSGTSLLEVLVALTLITIGALAVAPMFVSALDVSDGAADIGTLSSAAAARLESLRAEAFHLLVAGGSLATSVAQYSTTNVPGIVVRWEIVDGGGPTGTKTIAVRALTVNSLPNRVRLVEIRTLRSR